ncbi:MAG TPA: ABC transporter ATP-binding protein [Actinomycetota bacterium]|jgi:ABC-type branched-subunit amino acid transport system ATPase component|nr:ABC transporter ATP-binding protein [Actinomycetota bacterium]
MALLDIRSLSKSFGGVRAVIDVDFHADEGEIVSVIGPNGAGKTTLFNVVTGFYEPDKGQMRLDGQDLSGLKPNQVTKLGIARTFQTIRLFPNLTVLENAMVGQHCRTRSGVFGAILQLPTTRSEEKRIEQAAREALSFFGKRLSGPREDQLAVELAYADRRRLEIARAMATQPRLLLLDEPTAGMTPVEKREMITLIGRLREERGYSIVLIEHDMPVVKGASDRVVALDYGSKIAEGTYEEVSSNERVIEAYLGKQA